MDYQVTSTALLEEDGGEVRNVDASVGAIDEAL